MSTARFEYRHKGITYTISKGDLVTAMCASNECLSPKFNAQLQLLIDLLDQADGQIIRLPDIPAPYLKAIEDSHPELSVEVVQEAIRSYHEYTKGMYYL